MPFFSCAAWRLQHFLSAYSCLEGQRQWGQGCLGSSLERRASEAAGGRMRARAFLSTPAVLVAARAAGLSGKAQRRAVVDTPHRCELARAKQPNHAQRVSLGWTHEFVVLVRHGGGCRGCSLHRRGGEKTDIPRQPTSYQRTWFRDGKWCYLFPFQNSLMSKTIR